MQGSFVTTTVVTVVLIASVFGFFMLFRFAVWWYFGIDEHLANQKRIIALLEQSLTSPSAQPPTLAQASQQPARQPTNPLTTRRT